MSLNFYLKGTRREGRGGGNTPIPGGEIDIKYLKPDTHYYFLVDKYNKNKTLINSIFKLSLYFNKQSYKKVYKLRFFG